MKKIQSFIIPIIAVVLLITTGVVLLNNSNNQTDTAFLEKYELNGLSVEEIVYRLDSSASDPTGLSASITSDHLILRDESEEVMLPLPEDKFYLSFAPYISQTHPCGTHSLSGCQGELVNQEVLIVFTDSSGNEITNAKATTMENGFVGIWLDRDIEGTVTVTYNGLVAEAPFATFEGSNTCMTTPLQLS